MDTTVYLIRHSMKMERTKNHWPGYDRIQPLSVEGERRAQALADVEELRGADAAYSSPFARTISTLRYITEADGLLPYLDDRLRELEFGAMFPPGWQPPGPGGGPPPGDDIRARQWIDRDLAAELLEQCPVDEEAQIAEELRKKHFDPDTADTKERRRMAAYLARHGYAWSLIESTLRNSTCT